MVVNDWADIDAGRAATVPRQHGTAALESAVATAAGLFTFILVFGPAAFGAGWPRIPLREPKVGSECGQQVLEMSDRSGPWVSFETVLFNHSGPFQGSDSQGCRLAIDRLDPLVGEGADQQ
jgi:hypothetical protein